MFKDIQKIIFSHFVLGMVDYTDGPSTTLQSSGDTEMYSQSQDSKALYSSTEVLPSETTIPNKKATSKFSSSSDSAVLYNSSEANTRGTTESDTTTLRNSTDPNTITTRKVYSNSVSTASCNSSETVLSQTTESYNHRPRNITSPNPNITSKFSSSSDSTALYNSSGAPSSETTKSDTTILRNTTDLNVKTTASSDFTTSYTSTEVPPSETREPYTITARNITNTKTETTSMFSSSLDSSSLYNSSEMLLSETTESYSTVTIATTTDPKAKTTAFLSSSSALYNSSEALPGEMKEPYTTTHRNITSSNVKTTLNFPLTSVSKAILYKNYSEMLTYQASETIETFTATPSNSTSPKANTDTEAIHVFAETSTQKDIVTRPQNSNLDNTYISASNCTQLCCTNYHLFCHKDKMVHKQNTTKIFHDMNIDKTTTGRHTRHLSSATDHRTSSKAMGIGAMLIIGSIVAFVVAMDVPIVVNYIRGVHHLNYPTSV